MYLLLPFWLGSARLHAIDWIFNESKPWAIQLLSVACLSLAEKMEEQRETLRVKDEELQNLAQDIRACDSTIKHIAEKLSKTAEAAEAAACAAYTMDEQRRIACAEIEHLIKDSEKQQEVYA